jgi:hypothetical protein
LAGAGVLAAGAIVLGNLLATQGALSLQQPLSVRALGLVGAILLDLVFVALLAYWSVAALRLRYRLDRNGLMIWWGASCLVVPMERIRSIVPGSEVNADGDERAGWQAFRGLSWAGLRVGHARFSDGRPVRVLSTGPLSESAVVFTPDHAYVVSPRDQAAFIQAWQVRRPLGPTQYWREEEQRSRLLGLSIWRDRMAWTLVGLGLLANLSLHVYLTFVFDQLPQMLPVHFNVVGQADRIASRTEVLRFPQVALVMLVLDLILGFVTYRRQRVAAYLIWGGGLVLQWLVWGAVLTIVG